MFGELKELLSGRKVYLLMAFGAMAALAQYFIPGLNLGIDALPPVTEVGDLISQLWAFAAASGFRAAIAK